MTPAQCIMAFWMLVTGSINTISTKYADMQCVPDLRKANPPMTCSNSTVPAGAQCPEGCETFDHPFVQAAGMFVGELLCMFAFKVAPASARPRRRAPARRAFLRPHDNAHPRLTRASPATHGHS